jgi:benzoyl-CoA-dihydrodiol lyase
MRTSPWRSTAARRAATITVKAPTGAQPSDIAAIEAAGAAWWPLAMARQLDDAILNLRTNELEIGTWILKTEGDAAAVLAAERRCWRTRALAGARDARPAAPHLRPPRRLSRTLFALIEPGSCFAGLLAELAFAADRAYMLALPDDAARARSCSSTPSTSARCRW